MNICLINLVEKFAVFKNFNINLAGTIFFSWPNKYDLEQILGEPITLFCTPNREAKL